MSTIGFIGGGRVARILIGGWRRAGAMPATSVHEPDDGAFKALAKTAPWVTRTPLAEAASKEVVFLALHPPAIRAVLPAVSAALDKTSILVSLAPKVTLDALAAGAGTTRVVRMIPNAPSLVCRGYNPVVFGHGIDVEARRLLFGLFGLWGDSPEVEEAHLEAYALLTGMGPTYYWFQWQELRELAATLGISRFDTDLALRAMLIGAVETLLDSGLSPTAVMDLIPARPLEGAEATIVAAYRSALPALHDRIRPVPQPVA